MRLRAEAAQLRDHRHRTLARGAGLGISTPALGTPALGVPVRSVPVLTGQACSIQQAARHGPLEDAPREDG
ncbi:hypothetical protein [Kineococcus sp. SYSU DK005]|uniref:hypothetical protein n=1 Tax=Kineococcus sp. SYSU DK005 TaxID=3383126 RepID=UPI003D7D0CFB